ncbi:phage tail protein [Desulfoluna butyratoxydans]|uniref:Phage tail fibre protein n=1 Tax=Desulfoluna butyratoxydans TaxID=231438 RepID=A0A4U8YMI6_9BACT|nr:phage tail protein [Desulfoluna butyratoxydans]VFQ44379.1 phage tail fibre protein [Desulfoluna butyratoxydans]
MPDVPLTEQQYGGLLTLAGQHAEANAKVTKEPVDIVAIVIGDGGGQYVIPNEAQTELVNQLGAPYPVNVVEVRGDADTSPVLHVETVIPAEIGGITVREIGGISSKGVLVAVANCPPNYKPMPSQNAPKRLPIRMNFAITSDMAWNATLNDDLIFASREWAAVQIAKDLGLVIDAENASVLKGSWYVSNGPNILNHGITSGMNYEAGNLRKTCDGLVGKSGRMVLPTGMYDLGGETVDTPPGVAVTIRPGVIIKNGTLNINGALHAGLYHWIDTSTVINLAPNFLTEIYPQWFGPIGSSVDSSLAINAAIAMCVRHGGGDVKLTSGSINIDNSIYISSGNQQPVTLSGVGADRNHMDLGTAITTSTVLEMIQIESPSYYARLRDFSLKNNLSRETNITVGIKAINGGDGYVARADFCHIAFKNLFYGIDMSGDGNFNYADGMTFENLKFETVNRCIKTKHTEGSTINRIIAEPFVDYVFYLYQGSAQLITNVIARGVSGGLDNGRAIFAIVIGTESDGLVRGHSTEFNGIHLETVNALAYIGAPYVTFKNVHYHNISPEDYPRDNMVTFLHPGSSHPFNCTLENIWTRFVGGRAAGTKDLYALPSPGTSINIVEQTVISNFARVGGLRLIGWEPESIGGNITLTEKASTMGSDADDVPALRRHLNQLMSDLRASGVMGLVQHCDNGNDYSNWHFTGGGGSNTTGIYITGADGSADLPLTGIPEARHMTIVFKVETNALAKESLRIGQSSISGTSLEVFQDLPEDGEYFKYSFVTSPSITSERIDIRLAPGETGSITIADVMLFDGDQTDNPRITKYIEHGHTQRSYTTYNSDYPKPY